MEMKLFQPVVTKFSKEQQNKITANKFFSFRNDIINKKAFQSNANCLLADSLSFTVNRFEHV